ncbi:supervillin isoform X2 [Bradysia coprophila]|uniref:supervillin isoform X2 n=1 Tax=Bradysia coprophila TaxID=38358 RepID=UPI00187D9403|nr:supervillin isoform X2 [Bradysia coprophila]
MDDQGRMKHRLITSEDAISISLQQSPQKENNIIISSPLDGGNVSDRLAKIQTASLGWKSRVEQSDAKQFTVAAKLQSKPVVQLPFNKSDVKRSPPLITLKSINQPLLGLAKSPSMMVPITLSVPSKGNLLTRSISVPGEDEENYYNECRRGDVKNGEVTDGDVNGNNSSKVSVPNVDDDEVFNKFFVSIEKTVIEENVEIADFDAVKSSERLSQKRAIQGPKNRRSARNPLKTLAAREDLKSEYTEIKTGVADRELKRLKLESIARTSNLAVEALAGLASVEDFKSVNLKSSSLPLNQSWLPYRPKMLLQVKGRTHIQMRLVEPTYTSINQGDCFILIAPNKLYRYVGFYSNFIEQSRCKQICLRILENKDLGCTATKEIVISDSMGVGSSDFWQLLGKPDDVEITGAGHADEDDLFECCLIESNAVYEYQAELLEPIERYWGALPRVEMLDPKKVLVFSFGSEVYVWNGKNASAEAKRGALRLAQELFSGSYDYEMCELNPVNFSKLAGHRKTTKIVKSGTKPDWCLLAKITQNMETILFRQKFSNWPEFERDDLEKDYISLGGQQIKPLNGVELFNGQPYEEPNLVLENSNLGRGNFYYDHDTMRHFDILTQSVAKWRINEFNSDNIAEDLYCHFYSAETYIIRWMYQISITVRELSGEISKRNTVGRDRCVYFCWQGSDASTNEKGAAALLTDELNKAKGSQMRLSQGEEPTAFLRLFRTMFVHRGNRDGVEKRRDQWRLFVILGNSDCETVLIEVNCEMKQLRSRASFLLVNGRSGQVIVWHGCRSLKHTQEVAIAAADAVKSKRYEELFSDSVDSVELEYVTEGEENDRFFEAIGSRDRGQYFSLVTSPKSFDFTPRMFRFSSTNGKFEAVELLSQLRTKDLVSPYPFQQSILFNARQPTIFLIDNGDFLWLWQGWWPQEDPEGDTDQLIDNRSGEIRWQAERRAAMETVVLFYKAKQKSTPLSKQSSAESSLMDDISPTDEAIAGSDVVDEALNPATVKGNIVWAGLEPIEFVALFPYWIERKDIGHINIQDGRSEVPVSISEALSQLSQKKHPLSVLLTRPLPEGCDPTRLEMYLEDDDFEVALGVPQSEFERMPLWKQTKLKKDKGLF